MRLKKVSMYGAFVLAIIMLVACVRTYPNGDTEEVGYVDAAIDIIAGTPERKEMDEVEEFTLTGDKDQDIILKGKNAEIARGNEVIRKHNAGAKDDKQNPQTGLLTLITGIATALGAGYIKTVLNKKTIEAGRDMAHEENTILRGRIQSVKEAHREDGTALEKIKRYSAIGADLVRDNMELLKDHKDDIALFQTAYKELHEAKKA